MGAVRPWGRENTGERSLATASLWSQETDRAGVGVDASCRRGVDPTPWLIESWGSLEEAFPGPECSLKAPIGDEIEKLKGRVCAFFESSWSAARSARCQKRPVRASRLAC
jgi:hypothetical protein